MLNLFKGLSDLKIKPFILTIIAALFLCIPALAQDSEPSPQESLVLSDQLGQYPLGLHMDILEDPSGELTIDQVASPEYASRFKRSQENVPVYGYTNSIFWLQLRFLNQTNLTNQWLLEVNFPNLNYVDLYLPREGGGFWVKQSGALRPFDTRDIPYYHVVFELPFVSQAEQTFYVRIQSGSSMTLAFTLWQPEYFAVKKISNMLVNGLFYGALLIILGYHLFLLYSFKEANYLYFCLFIIGSILFFSSYEGLADQYLWPGLYSYKRHILGITMSILFIFSLKFSDVFLDQKSRSPKYHLLFNLLIGVWGLLIVIVPFISYYVVSLITSILLLATPALSASAGIYSWRHGYHPARLYLISWFGFLLGIISASLVRSGVLPSTPLTERFYHIGLIWLILMGSMALANRINLLKKETEDANRNLRNSENRLSQILEGIPLGVLLYGKDLKARYINRRGVEILSDPAQGIRPDISVGRTLDQSIKHFRLRVSGSDQEYPLEKFPVYRALQGEAVSTDDVEIEQGDKRVSLEFWADPVRDAEGNVESAIIAFQDITQRKQAEVELLEFRSHLETLVEKRTDELNNANKELRLRLEWLSALSQVNLVMARSPDIREIYKKIIGIINNLFSAQDSFIAELVTRSGQSKILAHSCHQNTHPELTGSITSLPEIITFDLNSKQGNLKTYSKDQFISLSGPMGEHIRITPIQTMAFVPLQLRENIIGCLGLEIHDKDRILTPDESLLLSIFSTDIAQLIENSRLYEQTKALITVEERNRLARDLHDSVTQVLFSASLVAEVLPQLWKRDPEKAQESLEELRRLTRGALAEMRTMLLELRPSAIIKTPLSELLAQLTEAVTSRNNLPFQLFIERIPPLPEEVHVCFYRVAQEALNNVVKHAQASQVSVSLSRASLRSDLSEDFIGEVKLVVCDDGVGLTVREGGSEHLGLGIMRERSEKIGAYLSLDSLPGRGTTVTLTWHG